MERKLEDVGHRVETGPGYGLISDITHAAPSRGEMGRSVRTRRAVTFSKLRSSRLRPRLAPEFRIGGIRSLPMLGGRPRLR